VGGLLGGLNDETRPHLAIEEWMAFSLHVQPTRRNGHSPSDVYTLDFARFRACDRFQCAGNAWQQILQLIARRHEHDNEQAGHLQVLLEL
jgi:hypothetical protein